MTTIDPLPSWNSATASGSKEAIINFVEKIAPKFSPEDRIVTFDNDGTLWAERPLFFQTYFIDPSLLEQSIKSGSITKKELFERDIDFYIGKTTEEYTNAASDFVSQTSHPDPNFSNYKFVEMTYKPLIELLDYLRANQFQIYICSGGGRDFVRSFAESAYGIPPENVIGSSIVTEYDPTQGSGGDVVRTKVAENDGTDQADKGLGQYNDKEGKPVGIQRQIGKRPIMAVGNSTGDLQMFDYSDRGEDNSLIVLINHDDDAREFKYNDIPNTPNPGEAENMNLSLDKAQDLDHWIVVSMKDDFNTMFTSDS